MVRMAAGADPAELCRRLGIDISPKLLSQALTHRSYAYEHGGLLPNERLEFLGDAVLGIVVTDALYRRNPDSPEGHLAKMRSAVVNAKALAGVGRQIELGKHILLGKGEIATGGADKNSILADTVEAVIGAAYLDKGLARTSEMVHGLVGTLLRESEGMGAALDWKTSLQELTARLDLGVPEYVLSESGPDHDKLFVARVRLSDGLHGSGEGGTKKDAEQGAARATFAELSVEGDDAVTSGASISDWSD